MLLKYDRPVPRYTSYPTVPYWTGITKEQWTASVARCLAEKSTKTPAVSLYVHVPFCRSLCAFCGCTRVISRDYSQADSFVDTVLAELDLKLASYGVGACDWVLGDLHLGGGTPTWLPAISLTRLLAGLRSRFLETVSQKSPDISIEVDPRSFAPDHAQALAEGGVTRVSLGVQDFHEPTLAAIKRSQTLEQIQTVVRSLRDVGIRDLNFDFVYGLPFQTLESMRETAARVAEFRPSRIALYSYAHIPSLKPAQKGVEKHGLPTPDLKRALYETMRERLITDGYREIGMDHFALPSDELFQAQEQGALHRNFMGYTVQKTPLLLGLGPSSLSDSWFAFSQNEKDVELWASKVRAGDLNPIGGHVLSEEDLWRRQVILDLICRYSAGMSPQRWQEASASELVADGLLAWDAKAGRVLVTDTGRPFVRNICAQWDAHLKARSATAREPVFSRSV